MKYPPHILDRIRDYQPLSQLIGQDVVLTRRGQEYVACCPFHQEKSPSFTVNDAKGFYHCFGCGAHGDAFGFLVQHHGLSYSEAIEQLATRAGIDLPKPDSMQMRNAERATSLIQLMEDATHWYESQLYNHTGLQAREYLAARGLNAELARMFRLGYAPDAGHSLHDAMHALHYTTHQLQEAGLLAGGDQVQEPKGKARDKFRGRIIFPITNNRMQVVGFGGRLLHENEYAPKYLNSPQTPLFHKGQLLYHYATARKAATQHKAPLIVTEGYMDVIAFAKAGMLNAVAPMGTALTQEQLQLLWSACTNPILCMDGDSAGQRSMQKTIDMALPLLRSDRQLQCVFLPAGEDPDSLLHAQGATALARIIENAQPLSHVLWEWGYLRADTSTAEARAHAEHTLFTRISTIEDTTLRKHYDHYIKDQLWQARRLKVKQSATRTTLAPTQALPLTPHAKTANNKLEQCLILLPAYHPALLEHAEVEEALQQLQPSEPQSATLLEQLHEYLAEGTLPTREALHARKALPALMAQLSKEISLQPLLREGINSEDVLPSWQAYWHNYQVLQLQKTTPDDVESLEAKTHNLHQLLQHQYKD